MVDVDARSKPICVAPCVKTFALCIGEALNRAFSSCTV